MHDFKVQNLNDITSYKLWVNNILGIAFLTRLWEGSIVACWAPCWGGSSQITVWTFLPPYVMIHLHLGGGQEVLSRSLEGTQRLCWRPHCTVRRPWNTCMEIVISELINHVPKEDTSLALTLCLLHMLGTLAKSFPWINLWMKYIECVCVWWHEKGLNGNATEELHASDHRRLH